MLAFSLFRPSRFTLYFTFWEAWHRQKVPVKLPGAEKVINMLGKFEKSSNPSPKTILHFNSVCIFYSNVGIFYSNVGIFRVYIYIYIYIYVFVFVFLAFGLLGLRWICVFFFCDFD